MQEGVADIVAGVVKIKHALLIKIGHVDTLVKTAERLSGLRDRRNDITSVDFVLFSVRRSLQRKNIGEFVSGVNCHMIRENTGSFFAQDVVCSGIVVQPVLS